MQGYTDRHLKEYSIFSGEHVIRYAFKWKLWRGPIHTESCSQVREDSTEITSKKHILPELLARTEKKEFVWVSCRRVARVMSFAFIVSVPQLDEDEKADLQILHPGRTCVAGKNCEPLAGHVDTANKAEVKLG